MGKTISLEDLPRKAERLLQTAWEGHESVVLERYGEPVAAVVPIEDYRRLISNLDQKRDGKRKDVTTAGPPVPSLAYELPVDLLEAYQRLVRKKFSDGLTSEEEAELARVDKRLDEAELTTPLGQFISVKAEREHARRMAILDELIAKLHVLQGP